MIDRRLIYTVSTARYGSFTAAAEKAGVTQSAITKSVAELERELGYSIFSRTARGVVMTDEGRTFVERASRVLEDMHDLFGVTATGSDHYAGSLRIGVCPASLEWLLLEPISTLMTRYPSIRLDLAGGSFDRVIQQLRAGAIDVAFGYEAAFEGQIDFRRDTVTSLRATFFCRQGHPILKHDRVSAAELTKYELIAPSGLPVYDALWRKIYYEAGFDVQERLHVVDYFPIAERMVVNSDAISLTSSRYTHSDTFKKRFACVPYEDAEPPFYSLPPTPLCCATRLKWSPRPAVRAFTQACREHLQLFE